MLLLAVALTALVLGSQQGSEAQPPAAAQASDATVLRAAREWTALLDAQRWEQSWTAAGSLFRSKMPKEQWAPTVRPVREPLGAVSSRVLQTIMRASSLPGAPVGDYAILQFQTRFANRPGAIETVVLAREGAAWKVDGYFIR